MARNPIQHGRRAGVRVTNLVLDFKRVANIVTKKTVTFLLTFVLLFPLCFNRRTVTVFFYLKVKSMMCSTL